MELRQRPFVYGLIGLCLIYFAFEIYFNAYAMISVDEFWFAHNIYRFKDKLPYRDFAPYKTVLGYYFLLIPMLMSHGIMKTLVFTKNAIAMFNVIVLLVSSCWLTRFFSRIGVLISVALLLSSDIVLFYSTNIRVDLLSYWCCFLSCLFLLEKRFLFAGLLIGIAFITSQKAIWYIAASNLALVIYFFASARNLKSLWNILRFNLMMVLVIAIYITFWSWMSDWQTVINSMFLEAKAMYQLDSYHAAMKLYWRLILFYNPLLLLLAPLTPLCVLVSYNNDKHLYRRLFVVIYALTILLCLVPYEQVFPYYMQVTIPALLILYAAFFSWLFIIFENNKPSVLIGHKGLWLFITLYLGFVGALVSAFRLPFPYLFVCLIPILLGVYITARSRLSHEWSTLIAHMTGIIILVVGIVYPLSVFITKVVSVRGDYQKANLTAINSLLNDGSDYVAGIELVYNKSQPIQGLRHLMLPAVDYLYSPSPKLRQVMLASLYEDPTVTVDSIVAALKQSYVKFYVNNYRMVNLPPVIKNYLAAEYEHLWGSIYLYAPVINQNKHKFTLRFSGDYLLEAKSHAVIKINGKSYPANSTHYLAKGDYQSNANAQYRLKLLPTETQSWLNPAFQEDKWEEIIF